MDGKNYLTCAETAKLVRAALKKAFPGTKFSVRSHTYSGGASIDVRYTDGPKGRDVEKVAKRYAGASFDGMIDLKYHHEHYLCPDGTVVWARDFGHSFDNGSNIRTLDDMPPGTKVVSFGADYVFVHRDLSDEFRSRIEGALEAEYAEFKNGYDGSARIGDSMWGSDLFNRVASANDADSGEINTDWYEAVLSR